MYYLNLGCKGSGLTNQIFSFITGILIAYKTGHKVVVVDSFLNDYSKDTTTPISQIINIHTLNLFLKQALDIIVVDKYSVKFELNKIMYGSNTTSIDLTEYSKLHFYKNNRFFIDKNTNFNMLQGDPCFGIEKYLTIEYIINNYTIKEIYSENLREDICIDFLHSNYIHTFFWINRIDTNLFETILIHIEYTNDFIEKSKSILQSIDSTTKINVIHLRLEDDAIQHWSKMNSMNESYFKKYIYIKYITIIRKYINKNDTTILVSQSVSNPVIDFLRENGYRYLINKKFFEDREKNAIVDFLISKNCNSIFIGNFNFFNSNGSTFSYYIAKLLKNNVKKIMIDLDRICDNESVL